MRLVVDTNILISALLNSRSSAASLLDQWEMQRFELLTCEQQLEELSRVTRYPKIQVHITPSVAGRLINQLRKMATVVADIPRPDVSPDPHDDWMFGLAGKSAADYIVSGNKYHVLELGKYGTTRIVTLSGILEVL